MTDPVTVDDMTGISLSDSWDTQWRAFMRLQTHLLINLRDQGQLHMTVLEQIRDALVTLATPDLRGATPSGPVGGGENGAPITAAVRGAYERGIRADERRKLVERLEAIRDTWGTESVVPRADIARLIHQLRGERP